MFGWQAAYVQARNYEKKDNWPAAIRIYERLVRLGEADNAKVQFRLGHAYFRIEQLDKALPHLEHAVALAPEQANWAYRLAFVYERKRDHASALNWYDKALDLSPNNVGWEKRRAGCISVLELNKSSLNRQKHELLYRGVVQSKGPAWEQLNVLEAGRSAHTTDKNWLCNLAQTRFAMNRFEDAALAYAEALSVGPDDAQSYFMMGWSWQSCGRTVIAEKCFERACDLDERLGAKILGPGVFFQGKGQWRLAAEAYRRTLVGHPENAELNFRIGLALQKTYSWREAERYLARAILLGPAAPAWYYRHGLSLERLGQFSQAAESYKLAAQTAPTGNHYWFYRLGFSLASSGDFAGACEAYAKSFSPTEADDPSPVENQAENVELVESLMSRALTDALQSQSGELCRLVGQKAESAGAVGVAERAYQAATERAEKFDANLYYALGRVLAAQEKWESSAAAFSETRIFKRPFGVDISPYIKTPASKKSMTYLEFTESVEIADRTIVYESSHGASVSCNPLAMYRRIAGDPRFQGFTHAWVLNDKTRVPRELCDRSDVVLVTRESDLYLRYVATAKYLINNNTFPPYFTLRDGQQYLNTWHGTPLKTLGRDIKSGVMDHKNAARNFLQATHMVLPNEFTANCLMEKYDIEALYTGKLAVTGYPRNDSTIRMPEEDRKALRARLGISPLAKVVLYAPTWRGTLAKKDLDTSRLDRDLETLGGGNWHFIFRGHSVNDSLLTGGIADKYSVPPDIDTNDLLAIVDVLITDYSSIMFDFMATGKRIIYYAYDLSEYQNERGMYLDLNELPGTVCHTIESVVEALTLEPSENDSDSQLSSALTARFCELEFGESSQRAVDFFFFGNDEFLKETTKQKRTNALFYAGSFIPNGVTSSFLNLANELPGEDINLHVVLDPAAVAQDAGRQAKFDSMPENIRAIGRVGLHLVTPEERWVIDKFNSQNSLDTEEMWALYSNAHRREFRRMFGTAKFDAIICFEGYARFWMSLLGNPYSEPSVSSVYLHSVMTEERKNRFPYLDGVFQLYRYYDHLISVSESASEDNSRGLSEAFGLADESFSAVNNIINPVETLEGADLPLDADISSWFERDGSTFVSVGRLSPEKGHSKLIQAFALVVKDFPNSSLIIVGDGPMRESIDTLVESLGLVENVLIAGMRMNPYAIVRSSDCFVFSSDYEGQGIAILEALVLGKPVISTDVTGPRSVLSDGHGLLVENSITGLADGMKQFIAGNLQFPKFDFELYRKSSIDSFTSLALGKK